MKKRYDTKHRLLKTGESERDDGYYQYRWTTRNGKRHTVTAPTLEHLREREMQIIRDVSDGIRADADNTTLNDLYELWKSLKRNLKGNTFSNYMYLYDQYVHDAIGNLPVTKIKRSDIKRFYNSLVDERGLKISSVNDVHTVLHQVLQLAVEDNYIRSNVSDNMLKELRRAHNSDDSHKRALTVAEQELFMNYLSKENCQYHHWWPIFTVMLGTGMRVGEVCGLRWEDIDLEQGLIDVNHTLVYYNRRDGNGCSFGINTPKTKSSKRQIPMTAEVKKAFLQEKENQGISGIQCSAVIDGYTHFIFVNRFGNVQHQVTLNKAIRRIVRDCNDEQILKSNGKKQPVLLPNFSCHSLRHTFTTRLVEAGVNIKVIQDLCGHSSSEVTLDIYTTVTKELKEREFGSFEQLLDKQRQEWRNLTADVEEKEDGDGVE